MFDAVLAQLAVVAAFVQRVIDFVKPFYQASPYQKHIDLFGSMALSAGLCVAWNVDVFAVVDINFTWAWLGSVFTGLFAGMGANVLNDLLKVLEMLKKRNAVRG